MNGIGLWFAFYSAINIMSASESELGNFYRFLGFTTTSMALEVYIMSFPKPTLILGHHAAFAPPASQGFWGIVTIP